MTVLGSYSIKSPVALSTLAEKEWTHIVMQSYGLVPSEYKWSEDEVEGIPALLSEKGFSPIRLIVGKIRAVLNFNSNTIVISVSFSRLWMVSLIPVLLLILDPARMAFPALVGCLASFIVFGGVGLIQLYIGNKSIQRKLQKLSDHGA